jgi:Spy/CpxP family protein refolding chaperone
MTAPTAPASKRPRGPLLAALVLLLALFVGGVAGVALDRHVLLPRMFRSRFHHFPGRAPPRDREFRNRFAKEVGLSPEQQTRIDSIMDRQGRELRTVRGKVQPQLDSIISRTRRALDSVLTPEQRKKAEEIRRRHPRPPGPPPGNFGPGPDGPPAGPPPESPPR